MSRAAISLVTVPVMVLGGALSWSALYVERNPHLATPAPATGAAPVSARQRRWVCAALGLDALQLGGPLAVAHEFFTYPSGSAASPPQLRLCGSKAASVTVFPADFLPPDEALPDEAAWSQTDIRVPPAAFPSAAARDQHLASTGCMRYLADERDYCLSRVGQIYGQSTERRTAQVLAFAFTSAATVIIPLVYKQHRLLGLRGVALASFLPIQALVGAYIWRCHTTFDDHVAALVATRDTRLVRAGLSLARAEQVLHQQRRRAAVEAGAVASLDRWLVSAAGNKWVEFPLTSSKVSALTAALDRLDEDAPAESLR